MTGLDVTASKRVKKQFSSSASEALVVGDMLKALPHQLWFVVLAMTRRCMYGMMGACSDGNYC